MVLCHGVAANHLTFEWDPPHSVAHLLAEAGFDCYSVDLRGYGSSSKAPRGQRWLDVDIDAHILLDGPALIDLALRESGARRAFWVGHSMGGLVGYGVCASETREKLAGLVTLGSPAFFRYPKLMQVAIRLGAWGGRWAGIRPSLARLTVAPVLGYFSIPLGDIAVNPRGIRPRMMRQVVANLISSVTSGTLSQFREWILGNVFRSRDGKTDYREGLRNFPGPLLVMGGSEDRLAPPDAVGSAYELAETADKTMLIFGRDRGDKEQYGHADLLFGTGAPEEVYPQIRQWLEAKATPGTFPEAKLEGGKKESPVVTEEK